MTIVSDIFDSTILIQPATRSAAAEVPRQARSASATPMPSSLWRYTQSEEAAEISHRLIVRRAFAVIATLGLGSVAYAIWQTCALMSGHHLQDAIAAFLR